VRRNNSKQLVSSYVCFCCKLYRTYSAAWLLGQTMTRHSTASCSDARRGAWANERPTKTPKKHQRQHMTVCVCVCVCVCACACADPYVKIWLLIDGKKTEKRKTSVSERTLNPTYNELFMFCFPYERVRQASLSVSVMDKDRFGRNELIGRVVLGAKSGPTEVKHWNDMFAKSRQPVARWHLLRDFRWIVPLCTSASLKTVSGDVAII